MSIFSFAQNAGLQARFRSIFKTRDLFFHDGSTLRRIRLSARTQLLAASVVLAIVGWSMFAALQFAMGASTMTLAANRQARVAVMEQKIETMRTEVEAHARRLEKRQAFLVALLSGQGNSAALAKLLPQEEDDLIARLQSLDENQLAFAEAAKGVTDARYKETSKAIRALGLKPTRFHRGGGAMGGPYEPIDTKNAVKDADPEFRDLFLSWKKLEQLEQGVMSIPSQKPVASLSFTSLYGVRSDPFRHSAAMHAGVDIPGPLGTPIYAAADGIVGRSQWVNGYGKFIEINHGKGIQTRYGHMSQLLVPANTRVKRGELIGRMGSTGRSTGNHLHYEVRIDGRAVNPIPFLQSSDYLVAVQQRAAAAETQVAVGGPEDETND